VHFKLWPIAVSYEPVNGQYNTCITSLLCCTVDLNHSLLPGSTNISTLLVPFTLPYMDSAVLEYKEDHLFLLPRAADDSSLSNFSLPVPICGLLPITRHKFRLNTLNGVKEIQTRTSRFGAP
jgi:hypothetical protein